MILDWERSRQNRNELVTKPAVDQQDPPTAEMAPLQSRHRPILVSAKETQTALLMSHAVPDGGSVGLAWNTATTEYEAVYYLGI